MVKKGGVKMRMEESGSFIIRSYTMLSNLLKLSKDLALVIIGVPVLFVLFFGPWGRGF